MPLEPIFDIPDKLKHQTSARLARMVQTMAGLAALGGAYRQIDAAEVSRRVTAPKEDVALALEDLLEAGYIKHHTNSTTHFRIYA